MEINTSWISILIGLSCGIISGFGIGGGSLLMVWMTSVASLDQKMAQGINLIYFIPTSIGALLFHIKNKMIAWNVVIPAAICGCTTAIFSAKAVSTLDVSLLRKMFGVYLCFVGIKEFFTSAQKE